MATIQCCKLVPSQALVLSAITTTAPRAWALLCHHSPALKVADGQGPCQLLWGSAFQLCVFVK